MLGVLVLSCIAHFVTPAQYALVTGDNFKLTVHCKNSVDSTKATTLHQGKECPLWLKSPEDDDSYSCMQPPQPKTSCCKMFENKPNGTEAWVKCFEDLSVSNATVSTSILFLTHDLHIFEINKNQAKSYSCYKQVTEVSEVNNDIKLFSPQVDLEKMKVYKVSTVSASELGGCINLNVTGDEVPPTTQTNGSTTEAKPTEKGTEPSVIIEPYTCNGVNCLFWKGWLLRLMKLSLFILITSTLLLLLTPVYLVTLLKPWRHSKPPPHSPPTYTLPMTTLHYRIPSSSSSLEFTAPMYADRLDFTNAHSSNTTSDRSNITSDRSNITTKTHRSSFDVSTQRRSRLDLPVDTVWGQRGRSSLRPVDDGSYNLLSTARGYSGSQSVRMSPDCYSLLNLAQRNGSDGSFYSMLSLAQKNRLDALNQAYRSQVIEIPDLATIPGNEGLGKPRTVSENKGRSTDSVFSPTMVQERAGMTRVSAERVYDQSDEDIRLDVMTSTNQEIELEVPRVYEDSLLPVLESTYEDILLVPEPNTPPDTETAI